MSQLDERKLIHIGMDGPNVNLKFADLIGEDRSNQKLPVLLELGTCNCHVLHGAFQVINRCIVVSGNDLELQNVTNGWKALESNEKWTKIWTIAKP